MPDPRIEAARRKAHVLYEGVETPHRSCGIALAETFGLDTRPYQAFRKGGITGEGPCGSIQAGLVILGQLLGDPDPTGPVTPELRAAAEEIGRRLVDGGSTAVPAGDVARSAPPPRGRETIRDTAVLASTVVSATATPAGL